MSNISWAGLNNSPTCAIHPAVLAASSKHQHLTVPSTREAPASGLPDTRQLHSLPVHSMCHSSSASAPLAANTGSHAQHRQHKGKQSHALHAYLLDKTVRHFCLLSADEWCCLGCEIGL